MKIFTVLGFCMAAISIQAQNWDCNCDIDPEAEFICAADEAGNIIPVPNPCFAECFNLTVVDSADCLGDLPGDDLIGNIDCDCDESELDGEGICIRVNLTDSILSASGLFLSDSIEFETWVPSECFAECFGFTDYEIIECDSVVIDCPPHDSIWNDDWEWEDPFDCECDESELEGEGICIRVSLSDSSLTATGLFLSDTLVFDTWVPSECYAECWGFNNYVIVDCDSITIIYPEHDSIWNDDLEWDDPFDCECDESDFEGEGICIMVTFSDSLVIGNGMGFPEEFSFETWVPSECYAECWGFIDYVIVDCDSIWNDDWEWDDEWDDDPFGCECDESELEGEGLCILVTLDDSLLIDPILGLTDTLTFETWVPSECYAECWGFTNYEVIDCDSIYNDDPFGCECDESDLEGEGFCIEITVMDTFITASGELVYDSLDFITWVPSDCYAACWGYTEYTVVDCEDFGTWDDCDCEYSIEDEPVCVLTDAITGEICPFPNLCYAECAGYTVDDVVDCGDVLEFECFECFDAEIDPVCVMDDSGQIFPVPNACFAECLGFDIVDSEECGGFVIDGGTDLDLEIHSPEVFNLKEVDDVNIIAINVFPNPTSENVRIQVQAELEFNSRIVIGSMNGQVVMEKRQLLNKGMNTVDLDVSSLLQGVYMISIMNDRIIHSERLIKL